MPQLQHSMAVLLSLNGCLARICGRVVSDGQRNTFRWFGFLACLDPSTLKRLQVSVSFRCTQFTLEWDRAMTEQTLDFASVAFEQMGQVVLGGVE